MHRLASPPGADAIPEEESPLPPPTRAARTTAAALVRWFQASRRNLPWRVDRTPYRVWLSEVMLQQTQVSVVDGYFRRFVHRFPNVQALAAASVDDVLALWSGLGYYSRGRNLHRAAKDVVEAHGGAFPTTSVTLRTLPGVGEYTAAAIASFAFGERIAVVDGNVARVLSRLNDDDTPVDAPVGKARIRRAAQQLVDAHSDAAAVNEALMELGALVCTPRTPDCPACPWRNRCGALAAGRVSVLPVKGKKRPRTEVRVACAVLMHDGAVWLERRAASGLFGGLWEPPSAALDDARATVRAVHRRLLEERGVPVPRAWPHAHKIERQLTHRDLIFVVVALPIVARSARRLAEVNPARGMWVSPAQARSLGLSSAVAAVLQSAIPERFLARPDRSS